MPIHQTPPRHQPDYQSRKSMTRFGIFHRWSQSLVKKWNSGGMVAAFIALGDNFLRSIGIHRGDNSYHVDWFDRGEMRLVPVKAVRPTSALESKEPNEAE